MFQLKRKRSSDDDISIDSSSSLDLNASHTITRHHIPSGVNSRTLKRWRNNKPNEQAVHDYTMKKLFSAAQSYPRIEIHPSTPSAPSSTDNVPTLNNLAKRSQQTLNTYFTPDTVATTTSSPSQPSRPPPIPHPFFSLQHQQVPQLHFPDQSQPIQSPIVPQTCLTCQDCETTLMVSWDAEDDFRCGGMGCEKVVCERCSIGGDAMGMTRRCLDCAMHMA